MSKHYYQMHIRHEGLGKQRTIRGADPYLVEAAANDQRRTWNLQYAKKLEVLERRQERERRQQDLENNLQEADIRSKEAKDRLSEFRGLLQATLKVDDRIDWNHLKINECFSQPKPPPPIIHPLPVEPTRGESRFQPQLRLMDKFLPWSAKRKQQAAEALYLAEYEKWTQHYAQLEQMNQNNRESNYRDQKEWEQRRAAYEESRVSHNKAIDQRRAAYEGLNPEAILDYCELVLSRSNYPDCFPQEFELSYIGSIGHLVVNYQLPPPQVLPKVLEVKYVRTRKEFVEKKMPKRQQDEFYESVVCQIAIRTLHELYEADVIRALDKVCFNGLVQALNPGTGQVEEQCIMSVRTDRKSFDALNLRRVESKACFKTLGGVSGAKLSSLRAVKPLDHIDHKEDRFSHAVELERDTGVVLDEWKELIKSITDTRDVRFMPVGSLACLLGFPQREKYSAQLSREFANAITARGYGIEPDPRHGTISFRTNDEIALFKPMDTENSPAYAGISGLLQLCVLIASADDRPTEAEMDVARNFILENTQLTSHDQQRLQILELLLCRNPSMAKRSLRRAASKLPVEKRQMVGEVLVCVAGADGQITSSEWKALDRACHALKLPPTGLEEILKRLGAHIEEPLVEEAINEQAGESIPKRNAEIQAVISPSFALDMSKVSAIASETKDVIGLLCSVMDEEGEERMLTAQDPDPPTSNGKVPQAQQPEQISQGEPSNSLTSIEAKYRPLAQELFSSGSWSKEEFERLSSHYHLMGLDAYDAINEWADEALGDFILSGEDPILVNLSLLNKKQ